MNQTEISGHKMTNSKLTNINNAHDLKLQKVQMCKSFSFLPRVFVKYSTLASHSCERNELTDNKLIRLDENAD